MFGGRPADIRQVGRGGDRTVICHRPRCPRGRGGMSRPDAPDERTLPAANDICEFAILAFEPQCSAGTPGHKPQNR